MNNLINPFQTLYDIAHAGFKWAYDMTEANVSKGREPDPDRLKRWHAYRTLRDSYGDQMTRIKAIAEIEGYKIKES